MEEKNQNNQKNLKNEILKNLENNTEKEDILELIYKAREEKIDDIIKNINKKIKEKYKNLNDEEEKENIKVGKYIEEIYKQGFKDGINLKEHLSKT